MNLKQALIFSAVIFAQGVIPAQNLKADNVILKSRKPIINSAGETRYAITLSPFYLETLDEKAKELGYIQADPHESRMDDPEFEKPSTRLAADILSSTIGKKPYLVRSWAANEFEIYANPELIGKLFGMKGVLAIAEVEGLQSKQVLSQSTTIAAGDTYSGNEIIPWWIPYTGTTTYSGATPNSGRMWTIEGPLRSPISPDINLERNDSTTLPDPNDWAHWHSALVTGVIGAKQNNQLIRGINPGQPIQHIGVDINTTSAVAGAFNYLIGWAELTKNWGVINMSFNNASIQYPGSNMYEFDNAIGKAMARASNNFLITQSAGNNDADACGYGYEFVGATDPAQPWDGIMQIGAHDRNGYRLDSDIILTPNDPNNPNNNLSVSGSNYGSCVELWAPGKQITSLRYNTSTTLVSSGTSFAAPIAGAIANRHGDYNTRPIQREWFLKKNAQYNFSGQAAKWPTGTGNVLKKHSISSIWSPQTLTNISKLYNNSYQDMWNAGTAVGTIVIDLGTSRNVKFIRLTMKSDATVQTPDRKIEFSATSSSNSTGTATALYQAFTVSKHTDGAPITLALNNDLNTRYIIVNAGNYGSWLAYSEVEVYGQ